MTLERDINNNGLESSELLEDHYKHINIELYTTVYVKKYINCIHLKEKNNCLRTHLLYILN